MLMFEDNTIRLELPLKYPETIRVTFIPDVPGPLTIEINPVGEVISRPSTTHIADFPALNTDDSVTEPESEVEQGAPDVADK
ncbi:hypothetical protein EV424DRAFT_1448435, partial [Suillus variegatus]